MLNESVFFYTFITVTFYVIGVLIQKRFKNPLFNPLLLTIIFVTLMLVVWDIKFSVYEEKTKMVNFRLTPATVCLAIPLYEKLSELKKNVMAILLGILSGVITSAISVILVAFAFKLDREITVSLLPKSVTTAIGVGIVEELGGITALTAIGIIITGVFGNIIAESVCRIFKITEPVAIGTAIGTSSHVGGTAKAVQMGQTEGAVSGLAIALAGIMTVILAPIIANIFI